MTIFDTNRKHSFHFIHYLFILLVLVYYSLTAFHYVCSTMLVNLRHILFVRNICYRLYSFNDICKTRSNPLSGSANVRRVSCFWLLLFKLLCTSLESCCFITLSPFYQQIIIFIDNIAYLTSSRRFLTIYIRTTLRVLRIISTTG